MTMDESVVPRLVNKPVVGYAGLTHLGLCSAIGAAAKGFEVVGFSEDSSLVERIASGDMTVAEPGLAEAFVRHRSALTLSSSVEALAACDVVFLAIDVATDESGASDLAAVESMLRRVYPHIGPKSAIVILSQVPPGFTRRISFERSRCFYQVETLIFGRALERATLPERFIVGCDDPHKGLPPAYRTFLEAFGCPILPMRYESAELAKIAINCFLVASVSTTNTLAELCEGVDADWAEIAPALRLDARIGPSAYLGPGLGIAGGNLERDLATVVRLGSREGSATGVIRAYLENSRHMKGWAFRTLKKVVLEKVKAPRLGILGLAYKQDTHSIKNSPSLALIEQLGSVAELRVHDPVVAASVAPTAMGVATAEAVAEGADAILLMTPWAAYRDLDPPALARRMRGRIVIDPYRLLEPRAAVGAGLSLYSIGRPAMHPPRVR